MTTSEAISALPRRSFQLENGELATSGVWYEGQPLTTQLLNAYTLLIPNGERFIIRTCRHYLKRAPADLREELEGLFFQEGGHAREHQRVLNNMQADGLSLKAYRSFIEWLSYRVLEPITPPALRLATSAAIEHHNAAIATFFLKRELLADVRNGELRRLFLWHFTEEIEHKETVFKLLRHVSPSWMLRAVGLLLSGGTFLLYLALGALALAVKSRAVLTRAFWKEVAGFCFGRDGLVRTLLGESWRYLKAGFFPSAEESRPLLAAALAELDRMGAARLPQERSIVSRSLPTAFARKVSRSVRRAEEIQSTHAFFVNRIDGYDDVWMRANGDRKLNLCTYSYLGLLQDPRIREAAARAVERHGTGAHGVRLLGGNLEIHERLESRIAAFFRREAAITFSSGFVTNMAVIGSLAGKGDYILSDELNHASIADGCRLSRAETIRFRHNDAADLAAKMAALPAEARKLIVVDAVYSMDGDVAPLPELIQLRDRFPNTLLMVDEAHSLGVLGRRGRGIEEHFDCAGAVDVLMGTLSKTIPCQGGYIAGSRELVTYLRCQARGFIFSAGLSPAGTVAATVAFEIIDREGERRRTQLMANVDYFVRRLREEGFEIGPTQSAIVPLLLRNETMAFEMARQCHLRGVYVMPVIFPAVARGTERLRIGVTSAHRREDLEHAVSVLVSARAADLLRASTAQRYGDQRETTSSRG